MKEGRGIERMLMKRFGMSFNILGVQLIALFVWTTFSIAIVKDYTNEVLLLARNFRKSMLNLSTAFKSHNREFCSKNTAQFG